MALRLLIARAANQDSLAWWADESLTPAADYVLNRLFPMAPGRAGKSLAPNIYRVSKLLDEMKGGARVLWGKDLLLQRGEAEAPVWGIVTSQEKLEEVVAAIDDKRVNLARLQDRFRHRPCI